MGGELEEVVRRMKEKYKIDGLKEPLLSQENVIYLLWRIKGLIWNEAIKELEQKINCDLGSYIDKAFDELSTLSDSWLEEIAGFNSECLQSLNNRKIIEMLVDMLILRSVYYQLSKSF